jgi:hypothetical protein
MFYSILVTLLQRGTDCHVASALVCDFFDAFVSLHVASFDRTVHVDWASDRTVIG